MMPTTKLKTGDWYKDVCHIYQKQAVRLCSPASAISTDMNDWLADAAVRSEILWYSMAWMNDIRLRFYFEAGDDVGNIRDIEMTFPYLQGQNVHPTTYSYTPPPTVTKPSPKQNSDDAYDRAMKGI